MQALRLARPRLPLRPASRAFAAAASSAHGAAPAASSSASPVIPLSNVEAMWERLSADEQLVIHQQLEELQPLIDAKEAEYTEAEELYYDIGRDRECPSSMYPLCFSCVFSRIRPLHLQSPIRRAYPRCGGRD